MEADLPSNPDESADLTQKSVFECWFCHAPESPTCSRSIVDCTNCWLIAYCSDECQDFDYYNHSPVCNEFRAVNRISVLHTSKSWDKHIAALRKRAARLPDDMKKHAIPLFRNPRVCHTCHEARIDCDIRLCECGCVCYCSEICAFTDKMHKKYCKKLKELKESYSQGYMRDSYPASLDEVFIHIDKFGPEQQSVDDIRTLDIHVITSTPYFDAESWELYFVSFRNLERLNLMFIIQGLEYNPSYDKSDTISVPEPEISKSEPRNCIITYSVHQKSYHMFFSSHEYTEPDLVVAFGTPYKHDCIHSEISYCNMTYCKHTILVLMDSTKESVVQAAQAVNEARPVKTLMSLRRNGFRGFGAHVVGNVFDVNVPNVKSWITCLCRE